MVDSYTTERMKKGGQLVWPIVILLADAQHCAWETVALLLLLFRIYCGSAGILCGWTVFLGKRHEMLCWPFKKITGCGKPGMVDTPTWRALGVTCLPSQYYPPNDFPTTLPSFPSVPSFPGPEDKPQTLPSFPDKPLWEPPNNEPNLNGLNYTWEEIGDFRYILTTNKSRYTQGEDVYITFRKRNITDGTIVLRYPPMNCLIFIFLTVKDRSCIDFQTMCMIPEYLMKS